MLKVLIIGSEGFVGYNLIDGLSDKFQVLTSDIIKKDISDNYTQCDITNYNQVINTVKNVDVVINLAALISIPYSYQASRSYIDTNVNGLLNILTASISSKVPELE